MKARAEILRHLLSSALVSALDVLFLDYPDVGGDAD